MGFCRICRYGACLFMAVLYGDYLSNEILSPSHSSRFSIHLVLFIFIYHLFPAFTSRGNIIFRIKTGKDGEIFTDKAAVKFADIKKIEMNRNKYRLKGIFQEDVIIQTTNHKTIRIPTWNIIPNPLFFEAVERYIVPHMNDEAKTNWIGQFTEIQRNVYLKEFENHPKL